MRPRERAVALGCHAIELPRACAFILLARAHQALGLQAIERGIDRADRSLAASAGFDLAPHLHPVCLLCKAQDREHDDLFELAEEIALRHFYKVESVVQKVK